jgi:bacilliredoxin
MEPLKIMRQPAGAAQTTMYDEAFIAPMRQELVRLGFEEMRTPEEVDARLPGGQGTTLVVVNSMCGCAAGRARPGVALALQRTKARPERLTTVFAGQDRPATERARSHFEGYPPSSPQMALFKDGKLVFMMQRSEIEGRDAPEIAEHLKEALEKYCTGK